MAITQKELASLISTYRSNPCFGAILDDNASREKHHKLVTVERQQERLSSKGHAFTRGEIIRAMKSLQNMGITTFIIGRRGSSSRMEWM